MFPIPGYIMQRARASSGKFFHMFGIHCATHQIRLIMISSVVITTLLFPAIDIYSSSRTPFFALTLRALDSFLTPDDLSGYLSHHDLRQLWEGYDHLHVREDSVARARCGSESTLRSEQVLVHGLFQDDSPGTLIQQTLLSAHDLEHRISEGLFSRGVPCVRGEDGRCFTLSPLAFWSHDYDHLQADDDLMRTINASRNVSISGIPVVPEMVLAGTGHTDTSGREIDSIMFLVMTYLFPDADCASNAGHFTWLRILEEAVSSRGDLLLQAQPPKLIALEYDKNMSGSKHRGSLWIICCALYVLLVGFFTYQIRRMDKVHSRMGLVFTGLVEIVVSTVTSLSVCALAGFKMTMVPWEFFPLCIVFIGMENMFTLVDAVVKTSITLPVKLRIAEGLSRAGTSNTLKLIAYNTVFGVIAGLSSGALRQFSAFAVVVLVAHWFLIHTFFVTVLSIDIQRLELDELLRQDASLAPSIPSLPMKPAPKPAPRTAVSRIRAAVHSLLRGRATKNISLLLLLAITATLYYVTSPGSVRANTDNHLSLLRNGKMRGSMIPLPDSVPPALRIWQTLNPANDEMVHIRVESPTILVLGPQKDDQDMIADRQSVLDQEKNSRSRISRLWMRIMRPVAWLLKIVVMPMAVTTTLLYALLLYLLKDADRLETQRNRGEADSPTVDESIPPVEGEISFKALPRAFPTDVDLIAASTDCSVVVAVGLQNELVLWRVGNQTHTVLDTSALLLGDSASAPSAASMLTAVAVDANGTFCAVGTGTGVIAIWSIGKGTVKPLPQLSVDSTISPVTHIHFASDSPPNSGRSTPIRSVSPSDCSESKSPTDVPGCLYATYENGAAIKWTVTSFVVPSYITPSRSASVTRAKLLSVHSDGRLLLAFSMDDGTVELCNLDRPDGILPRDFCITAGNPSDFVVDVHACKVELEGEARLIIAAVTQAGIISLWDGHQAECIHILDEPFGTVNRLRVTPVSTKTCPTCGELPFENFSLSFSIDQVVLFYRAYLTVAARRCSCVQNQPRQQKRSGVLGRRSRSGSAASSAGTLTPTHSRSRISSISSMTSSLDAPSFPVSGHGVHSRRASDKEVMRRNLDAFVGSDFDEYDNSQPIGPQDVSASSVFLSTSSRSALWQNLVVVRTADATCERGGWDVANNNQIVGIRRKPRIPFVNRKDAPKVQLHTESSVGLTPSTMERWELWTFIPPETRLQASPLCALVDHTRPSPPTSRDNHPNQKRRAVADVVPRLHFTRVSPFMGNPTFCIAGFGNTVGIFDLSTGFGQGSRQKQNQSRTSLERLREVSNHFF